MLDPLESAARRAAPAVDHWTVRGVRERSERLSVRQNIAEPPAHRVDAGVMVTVSDGGGLGHAATGDTSEGGLRVAFARAHELARACAGRMVFDPRTMPMPTPRGRYATPVREDAGSLRARLELLGDASRSLAIDPRIVDWSASLWTVRTEQLFLTSDGGRVEQEWSFITPNLAATASADGRTQVRSSGGLNNGFCQQGGLEVLRAVGMLEDGPRVAREALELALAPACPTGEMDVLLMPDQMMLQIHESIGHPLELDRILGDERNFAGTSFVTLDMFGEYRYGSELLNVSYDPTRTEQFASFAFDDEGMQAERTMIIERGLLLRPLGGALSVSRAGSAISGVATSRASGWRRAPIDRMSNLNVEPGATPLADMIAGIERGVMLSTNCSWSIDDSRNKFQFGCEYGRVIRNGRLAEVVRDANYRGISSTFWRSLTRVGDAAGMVVTGTPYCGKGEPGQLARVGHASPPCAFSGVSVFGGAS